MADRSVLPGWHRPVYFVERMNHHLLRKMAPLVAARHTLICLGDVTHPDAWPDRRLLLDTCGVSADRRSLSATTIWTVSMMMLLLPGRF